MSFSWRPSASPSTTTPCRCALHQKRCGVTSQTREQSQRRKKSSRSNASRRGQGCPWPLLQHFSKAALHVVSFSSSLIAYRTTAGCVDFDPRTPCMHNRSTKLFGETVCTHHAIRVNHTEIRCMVKQRCSQRRSGPPLLNPLVRNGRRRRSARGRPLWLRSA